MMAVLLCLNINHLQVRYVENVKFAKFQCAKNKALSKRLIHKSIPTVKSLLMSNSFPPFAGFCIA